MNVRMLLIMPVFAFYSVYCQTTFEAQWHQMQELYSKCIETLAQKDLLCNEAIYIHPFWQTTKESIKELLLGPVQKNFLQYPPIRGTMVRQGMGIPQAYELCYLENCIQDSTKEKISSYKESNIGEPLLECERFECSTNALGQLFVTAKILENHKTPVNTIIEFGSGYGNLAHMLSIIYPESTIFLIDIPELLALQYQFLKTSASDSIVFFHSSIPTTFIEKSINLIPIQLIKEFNIKSDLFISTMALSEATAFTQKIIAEKSFFNAKTVYITGQLNGWGTEYNFINHSWLINEVKRNYHTWTLQPLHFILGNLVSYEILALK